MKLKYRLIHKIIIGCFVLILLPLSIMAYRLYHKSDVYVEEQLVRQLETRLEDFNNFYLNEINGNILLFFNIWHLSPDFDHIFNNPKGMEDFRKEWQAALKGYPEVLSVYYADTSGNFLNYPDFEVSSDYDPTERQWYRDAYENPKQVQWSEPYVDYMTEEIIVTVSQAQIKPSGEIIGVFAIDITLEDLSAFLENTLITDNSKMLLVSRNHKIIGSSDYQELNQSLLDYPYGENVVVGKRTFTIFMEDKPYWVSSIKNKYADWTLIAVIPHSDFYEVLDGFYTIFVRIFIIVFIWGSLLILILILYSKKEFIKPLTYLQSKMVKAESGNLDFKEMTFKNRSDEIGALQVCFYKMIQGQKKLIHKIQETAQILKESVDESRGVVKLSSENAEIQVKSVQNLFEHLDQMEDSIQDVSNHMEEISNNLSDFTLSMQHMGIASGEIAKSSVETAESISDISLALRTLDQSIQSIHNNVLETTEQGVQMTLSLENGKEHLKTTKDAMKEAQNTIELFLSEAKGLADTSIAINEIIEVINDLTEQTTFLALNASIEAAKAGEHGKGFAVVANAVTRLSDRARLSTDDVIELVKSSQDQINHTVSRINSSAHAITNSMTALLEMEASFEKMEKSISLVNQQVEEIAKNVTTEVESSKTIMEASENVSDLTMEVSASTQEQVATFNELIEKIEQMNVSTNKVFDLTRDQVEQSKNITTSGSEINNMTFDLSVMSENVEMISEQIEAQAQALIQVMKQFKLEGSHDQE